MDTQIGFFPFSRRAHLDTAYADLFLSNLLSMSFEPVPDKDRRRIGAPSSPGSDASDHRPYWQPPMVFEGNRIKNAMFEAWRAKWPQDGTELSGKEIEIYLPNEKKGYPTYFPYWLQICSAYGKASVRIVDSGKGLRSPHSQFPAY